MVLPRPGDPHNSAVCEKKKNLSQTLLTLPLFILPLPFFPFTLYIHVHTHAHTVHYLQFGSSCLIKCLCIKKHTITLYPLPLNNQFSTYYMYIIIIVATLKSIVVALFIENYTHSLSLTHLIRGKRVRILQFFLFSLAGLLCCYLFLSFIKLAVLLVLPHLLTTCEKSCLTKHRLIPKL